MKTLSKNQMEESFGGKFWGTDCVAVSGTAELIELGGLSFCQQQWSCTTYYFWINFGTDIQPGGCTMSGYLELF